MMLAVWRGPGCARDAGRTALRGGERGRWRLGGSEEFRVPCLVHPGRFRKGPAWRGVIGVMVNAPFSDSKVRSLLQLVDLERPVGLEARHDMAGSLTRPEGGELPGVEEGERGLGEEAVRRMMWLGKRRGRASGKVAAVEVHESPSESRYRRRRRDEPTEAGGK